MKNKLLYGEIFMIVLVASSICMAQGKVLEWKLDEGAGLIAGDSTANNNDGNLIGFPTDDSQWSGEGFCSDPNSGPSLIFSGFDNEDNSVGNYVELTNGVNLPTANDVDWSMNVYVKPNTIMSDPNHHHTRICGFGINAWDDPNGTNGIYMGRGRDIGNFAYGLGISFMSDGMLPVITNVPYTAGKWQMVTVTYDLDRLPGDPLKIYKNGVLIGSGDPQGQYYAGRFRDALPRAHLARYNNFGVGTVGTQYGQRYEGMIDEFTIWNYALSDSEITAMSGCIPSNPPPVKVLEWELNEGDGNTAEDSTTNNNDGTLIGGPQWTEDINEPAGHALVFDGNDDTVQITSATNLPTANDVDWSMNVYLYLDKSISDTNTRICGFGDETAGPGNGRSLGDVNNRISFVSDGMNPLITGETYSVGRWQMITITYDAEIITAQSMKIYKDGKLIGSGDPNGSGYTGYLQNADPEVRLAPVVNGSSRFAGKIDGFTIWNGVITAEQRAALAARIPRSVPPTAKVLEWKLDETSGIIAYDATSNHNNGKLRNFPWDWTQWVGGALSFDGVNDYVESPQEATNLPIDETSNWSMNVFVCPNGINNIDSHGTRICGFGRDAWDSNGSPPSYQGHGRSICSFYTPPDDPNGERGISFVSDGMTPIVSGVLFDEEVWQMITVTYNWDLIAQTQDPLKIYKNGKLIASGDPEGVYYTGRFRNAEQEAHLARLDNFGYQLEYTLPFWGKLDEFTIWQGALTPAEILTLAGKIPGDFDEDSDVDLLDLNYLADRWLTNDPNADLSGDNAVNIKDFAIFGEHWKDN